MGIQKIRLAFLMTNLSQSQSSLSHRTSQHQRERLFQWSSLSEQKIQSQHQHLSQQRQSPKQRLPHLSQQR